MNIEDIKLPDQQAPTAPSAEGQVSEAPSQAVPQPQGQAANTPNQPAAPTDQKAEWDGDVNKLPPELQGWAKSVQRGFTKRSMAEAELRRKGQEFESFTTSDEYRQYQTWKEQQANPAPQQARQNEAPAPVITPQEWEEIQLDPTGTKLASKVDAMIQNKIMQAAATYGAELNNLKSTQNQTMYQASLSDLASLHPEVIEWHQAGIMAPFLKEELANKSHKSYDQAVNAAYEKAAKINDYYEKQADARLQQRVTEKKGLTTPSGVSTGEDSSMYVSNKTDAFSQAITNALEGKKVKVRVKK